MENTANNAILTHQNILVNQDYVCLKLLIIG